MRRGIGFALGLGLLDLAARAAAAGAAEGPRLAEYYGFRPLEIYKLDARINNLLIRDLDGDGTADVAVVNNGRSRIDLLLSGPGPSDDESGRHGEVNRVPSDRRMRLRSVPVNREVVSLQAGDLDGDGRPDLAFYGTPAELVVLFNDGGGKFGDRVRRIDVGEAVESGTALAVGDLDRDGRDDLALLAPGEILTVLQAEGGKLREPERLPHTAANPRMLRAVDLDGDGGDDLVLLDGDADDPVRVRFSAEGGRLGPEGRFHVESPRAIAFGPMDGAPGAELLTIESQSGRARIFALAEGADDESERRGRLIFHPLPRGDARGRSLAVGDLDGDKLLDVVVTDPANAQFLLYRQGPAGLGAGQSFPGLVGGNAVRVADLDGDGRGEVLVLSEKEKQVGRSVLEDGRLSFPAPLPLSGGEPVALEVARLDPGADAPPEVVYIARSRVKTNDSETDVYTLRALRREPSGAFVPHRWGETDAVEVKGLNGTPAALRVLDVNRDDRPDVLAFNAFGPPVLLLGQSGGAPPAPLSGGLGPLAGVKPEGLTRADLDGPALLIAQNTFARNLRLDRSGQWQVQDQYNTGRGAAQVVGAAALDTDGDGTPEIALLDRNSKSLLFLERREGVYRPAGSLSVGAFDFQGMHVADLDGDGRQDLLLAGTDKFGVVLTGHTGRRLKPVASYEPAREKARLGDLIAGDLNDDGRPDVVLTDVAEHFVEIVAFDGRAELDRALSFKIFEQKTLQDVDDLVEPRDLALGDVDGDGRTDLILIVHDRVLIYRQDPGPETARTAAGR